MITKRIKQDMIKNRRERQGTGHIQHMITKRRHGHDYEEKKTDGHDHEEKKRWAWLRREEDSHRAWLGREEDRDGHGYEEKKTTTGHG